MVVSYHNSVQINLASNMEEWVKVGRKYSIRPCHWMETTNRRFAVCERFENSTIFIDKFKWSISVTWFLLSFRKSYAAVIHCHSKSEVNQINVKQVIAKTKTASRKII